MIWNCLPQRIFSISKVSIILVFFVLSESNSAYGAAPVEVWNKTYGGQYGDGAWSLQETNDGGYIIVGNTATRGE